MSPQIINTKLHKPPPPPKLIRRPRLIDRMTEGLHRKLTLISAPAGFGKTSLVSEWLAGCERPSAWLSLDEGENDSNRYLTYIVAALQTVSPGAVGRKEAFGSSIITVLQAPQPPRAEAILTTLINEITAIPNNIILVLDDYHLIDSKLVDNATAFLLEHLPPQLHLVITTREDPNLSVPRLRMRDQLTELRAADLRFTLEETAEFFDQMIDLNLSDQEITALDGRTEGWVAGLQLAALALKSHSTSAINSSPGRIEAASFIKSFTGSHRYVMDYLVEEVLQHQPVHVQDFLMSTSILDRFCGPLCDAVLQTAPDSSQETLEYLEHANLLVVPLDDKRHWYRYHHLFADVLQARLMKEKPRRVAEMHLRASRWWEQNNFRSDAIHHALAAEDFDRAVNLIEQEWSEKSGTYFQSPTWLDWVNALPDDVVRNRPKISLGFAWELLFSGELEEAESRLREAERLLESVTESTNYLQNSPGGIEGVDDEKLRPLRASLALAQAYYAQATGKPAETVRHANRMLALVAETNDSMRGFANSLLGLAKLTVGDLDAAYTAMSTGMDSLRKAGNLLFATSGTYLLAGIRLAQGRLLEAISIYDEALELVSAPGEPVLQGTANLHLGLSELHLERGNLEAARNHLQMSERLGKLAALPEWPYTLYIAQARIKAAEKELDTALKLLDEAERLYHSSPVPNVRPISAVKARIWIRQGKLAEALEWAHRQALSVEDDLSYLREYAHLTFVRLLIGQYQEGQSKETIHQAIGFLERLKKTADAGGRNRSVIEIKVLQALAQHALGNEQPAKEYLRQALVAAEPQEYVRLFVDEGTPVKELLLIASKQGILPDYTGRLLATFDSLESLSEAIPDKRTVLPATASSLPERLTPREVEVLRLLAAGHSNPEIAAELIIALTTVKTHVKNIYGKLQVSNRVQAVAKTKELDLL